MLTPTDITRHFPPSRHRSVEAERGLQTDQMVYQVERRNRDMMNWQPTEDEMIALARRMQQREPPTETEMQAQAANMRNVPWFEPGQVVTDEQIEAAFVAPDMKRSDAANLTIWMGFLFFVDAPVAFGGVASFIAGWGAVFGSLPKMWIIGIPVGPIMFCAAIYAAGRVWEWTTRP